MGNINHIIDRVKKLLALGTSSNVHEAAAATAAANKLIDEYRLSQADLEVDSLKESIEEDYEYIYQSGKVTPWKMQLVHVLTSHYGVSYWNDCDFSGRKISRYRMVGRRSDIDIVKYMFSWLILECQRLCQLEVKGTGRVSVASYCMGFVSGIAEQLRLSREELKKSNNYSAAMVKINSRLNDSKKELWRIHPDLVSEKSTSSSQIDPSAFQEGQERGKAIHLDHHLIVLVLNY